MAESALATFVVFLWRCFVELMRLSLDLICVLLFIGALCMPWRWPFIPEAVCEMTSREEFEWRSAAQFGLGVGDARIFKLRVHRRELVTGKRPGCCCPDQ